MVLGSTPNRPWLSICTWYPPGSRNIQFGNLYFLKKLQIQILVAYHSNPQHVCQNWFYTAIVWHIHAAFRGDVMIIQLMSYFLFWSITFWDSNPCVCLCVCLCVCVHVEKLKVKIVLKEKLIHTSYPFQILCYFILSLFLHPCVCMCVDGRGPSVLCIKITLRRGCLCDCLFPTYCNCIEQHYYYFLTVLTI